MTKQVIAGYISGYGISHIKNWVNSILMCGFKGEKWMLTDNKTRHDVVEYLESNGFLVKTHDYFDSPAVVARFWAMENVLTHLSKEEQNDIEYIIYTDVKDVVFQRNPVEYIKNKLGKKTVANPNPCSILAGSENVLYKNEVWGNDNLKNSFPGAYNLLKELQILNAGTFAATLDSMITLSRLIFSMSYAHPRVHNPDQAAFNVLLRTPLFANELFLASLDMPWALQCGTILDPSKRFPQIKNVELKDDEGVVKIGKIDEPYVIIHQYDRVPWLKKKIDALYGEYNAPVANNVIMFRRKT